MHKTLTTIGRSLSITTAANSATGLSNSGKYRCTAPRKRYFCAHVMVSCAWEVFGPAGILYPGLLTRAQFATLSLSNEVGGLHVSTGAPS